MSCSMSDFRTKEIDMKVAFLNFFFGGGGSGGGWGGLDGFRLIAPSGQAAKQS